MMNVNMPVVWRTEEPGLGSLLKARTVHFKHIHYIVPFSICSQQPVFDSTTETPVEIVRPPGDVFEPPGSDIVFEAELNKDRVEVKWMRNNMIIVQGDKYQMLSEGKVHRLQVCEIRPRDQEIGRAHV